jgi:hypothetical protein
VNVAVRLLGVVLLVVGAACTSSSDDDAGVGDRDSQPAVDAVVDSIEGRWVLESWQEGEERIIVEVGVNTVDEPWIEFTKTTLMTFPHAGRCKAPSEGDGVGFGVEVHRWSLARAGCSPSDLPLS